MAKIYRKRTEKMTFKISDKVRLKPNLDGCILDSLRIGRNVEPNIIYTVRDIDSHSHYLWLSNPASERPIHHDWFEICTKNVGFIIE